MNIFLEFALTLVAAATVAVLTYYLAPHFSARLFSRFNADRFFYGLVGLYVAVFVPLTILRHNAFNSYGYDLGIFDQVIWNSMRGRLFENSIMSDSPSFLGHHFSPILLALVPLYSLWSDPRALLILQTLALASAALPLYWYVRAQVGQPFALVLGLAYLLSPALQYVNLTDFHEIALATPLLALTLFFLLRQRYLPFVVCLGLALLTKEEVVFISIAFALYLFGVQREWKWGAFVFLSAVSWGGFIFRIGIPYFRPEEFFFVNRYAYLGTNFDEIISTVLTRPDIWITNLLIPPKFEFVFQVLAPLAFLPLVGFEIFALAIPTFGYLLLSDNNNQFSIHSQYTAPLLPILFFAVGVAARRIIARKPKSHTGTALAMLILTASAVSYGLHAPAPLARHFELARYLPNAHTQIGNDLLQSITTDSGVLAQTNFVPHLSQRARVYAFPDIVDLRKADYMLLDQKTPILTDLPLEEFQQKWDAALASPYFETIRVEDGYILKKHVEITVTHPLQYQFDDRITLRGYTIESALPVRRGSPMLFVLAWRADQAIQERYVIFVHLLDTQGKIWAQGDREPGMGWFRTDRWKPGDLTNDRYALELDTAMPMGSYQIIVGLYDLSSGERLRTTDGQDHVILTSIRLQ
jgi:uncharacterized membrane protein